MLVDRKRKRGKLGGHQRKTHVSLLMLKGIDFHLGLEDWKKSLCRIASTTNAKNHLQLFKDANAEVAMLFEKKIMTRVEMYMMSQAQRTVLMESLLRNIVRGMLQRVWQSKGRKKCESDRPNGWSSTMFPTTLLKVQSSLI